MARKTELPPSDLDRDGPARDERRSGLSTGSKVFLVFLVLIVGGVGGGLWYANQQLAGEPGPGDPVTVEVERGANAAAIGEQLADEGIVRNALAFRLVARSRSLDANLAAGTYELETGMSVDEAIDALLGGPQLPETLRFTVPEGLSIEPTLETLGEQFDQYSADDFRAVLDERIEAGENREGVLKLPGWVPDLQAFPAEVRYPFEGLLFPETYEVFADETPQQILQRMIEQTSQVMASVPEEAIVVAAEQGIDRYEGLILASLVERETRVDDERDEVASVMLNRLESGQPLQIDATVLYALGKWKERVLVEDTNVESPYNTYENPGLPPTPIAGAGRAAIMAAFQPADTPFNYYVLAPECDGTHQFAETFDQHRANVAEFRESGRCQEG